MLICKLENLIEQLNANEMEVRLQALRDIKKLVDEGVLQEPVRAKDVNNHIHTNYSFSPYSPSKAIYCSWISGLVTTGIMDHDSISGAAEFIEAGKIMDIPTTIGAELRVSFDGTAIEGKRINNPDQETVAYVAMHGIPHTEIEAVKEFFVPILKERGKRNRAMTDVINQILQKTSIRIDYDNDVVPLSMACEGGSVTERHILFAVAIKMIAVIGKGIQLIDFLEKTLGIMVGSKNREYLKDVSSDMYEYDLLNVLKTEMVEQFYIPATTEAPPVELVSEFAAKHGIVLAYAYLGDIGESVTGDKKAMHFEDGFLDVVFDTIKNLDFKAITYMPSRNTSEQLTRLRNLCKKNDFFQISGEDINQPRQKFVCSAMRDPQFQNLYDAAWALIGHELSASSDLTRGMFSDETVKEMPLLSDRVKYFKNYAMIKYDK